LRLRIERQTTSQKLLLVKGAHVVKAGGENTQEEGGGTGFARVLIKKAG